MIVLGQDSSLISNYDLQDPGLSQGQEAFHAAPGAALWSKEREY